MTLTPEQRSKLCARLVKKVQTVNVGTTIGILIVGTASGILELYSPNANMTLMKS